MYCLLSHFPSLMFAGNEDPLEEETQEERRYFRWVLAEPRHFTYTISTNDVDELEFYNPSRSILIFKLKSSWLLYTQVTVDIGIFFEDLFFNQQMITDIRKNASQFVVIISKGRFSSLFEKVLKNLWLELILAQLHHYWIGKSTLRDLHKRHSSIT